MITLAVTVGMIFLGMQYGPQAAYFTELFSTEVRYSGASLGYQIGAILGGALAPTIAVLLWTELGIFYVSLYILLACWPHPVVLVSVGGDRGSVTLVSVRRVQRGLAVNLSCNHPWQGPLTKACP